MNKLPFQSITVRHYNELDVAPNDSIKRNKKKQLGAIQAMKDPFLRDNNCFDSYDWIIRLNPDVLIRNDEWMRATMLSATVDAILIQYKPGEIHTDFTAFRPHAIDTNATYTEKGKPNAERHFFHYLEKVIASGRIAWLPKVERSNYARVVGQHSPVIHDHALLKHCPNYFNATWVRSIWDAIQ